MRDARVAWAPVARSWIWPGVVSIAAYRSPA
jgi:hypothetical protein